MKSNTFPWGHVTALAIWVSAFSVAYFAFEHYQRPRVGAIMATGEVVIPRSRDGHFYLDGSINGHPITFMVDTGATTVSVDTAFARSAGLPPGRPERFSTAGGMVIGEVVSDQTVEAGGIRVEGLRVAVGIRMGSGEPALLGANFLRYVEVIQSGDRMILRARRDG